MVLRARVEKKIHAGDLADETSLRDGVSVVIPCLNESETILGAVLEAFAGLKAAGCEGEVIVADNGSQDSSALIAERSGARVVKVSLKGYGSTLSAGMSAAGFKIIVFGDGDLSYPFKELKNLVAPIANGEASFVLGTRLKGSIEPGAMPFLNRYFGTPLLSLLIRLFFDCPTSDVNSGMRAIRKKDYEKLDLKCLGMEFASEMLMRVAETKLKYTEVPINFRKDQRSRPPHLNRWRDGMKHLSLILTFAYKSAAHVVRDKLR